MKLLTKHSFTWMDVLLMRDCPGSAMSWVQSETVTSSTHMSIREAVRTELDTVYIGVERLQAENAKL